MMIEGLGVHRADKRNLVHRLADVREHLGHFDSGFPIAPEFMRAAKQHSRILLQESEPDIPGERLRQLLAVHLVKFWFRIEEVDLARAPFHEKEDALLR